MRLAILTALCGATATYAIPTIEAYGNKFFTSDGDQFFIKGNGRPNVAPTCKH